MTPSESRLSFATRFGATLLLGSPGVLALAWYTATTTRAAAIPAGLSRATLALSAVINSLLFLVPACLLGAYAAPRVGLGVYLFDRLGSGDAIWPRLRRDLPLAGVVGVVGAVAIVLLDFALLPFIAAELPRAAVSSAPASVTDVLLFVPVRFLYGGITEELLLRFGLMSALAFAGWFVTGRQGARPSAAVMWVAIVVSGVLFGVGHLPTLAAQVGLTPLLVARTIGLNAILGVAFGWLYWRRGLEAAMLAHVAFHVVVVALSLVQVGLL